MPKIKITEHDKTGAIQTSKIANTVFIPMLDAELDAATPATEIKAIKSVDDLDKFIDAKGSTIKTKNSLGYRLAKHTLNVGLDVLVQIVKSKGNIDWTSLKDKSLYDLRFITCGDISDDGTAPTAPDASAEYEITVINNSNTAVNITDANLTLNVEAKSTATQSGFKGITDIYTGSSAPNFGDLPTHPNDTEDTDITYASVPTLRLSVADLDNIHIYVNGQKISVFDNITNPANYTFKIKDLSDLLKNAGLGAGCMSAAVTCANTREDCIALLNLPTGYAFTGDSAQTTIAGIENHFKAVTPSTYVAAFVPNFKTLNSDLAEIDETTKKEKETEIPAAFGYIFAYANMIKNNPEWYAVAGFQRGIIPELSDVCYDLSGGEIDLLQKRTELDDPADNVGVAINPIANIRPAGYIIYGNRTMKSNDAAKKTTAQSFLNVRNTISAIKKQTYNAARTLTFEPNTEMLWIRFKAYIQPLLDQMQNNNGILGYKFTRLKTDAKARLKCSIAVVPVEAVEDFEIKVVLTDDLSVSE